MEIIPTGYLLIDGHHLSSVEYISNTRPIPANKAEIVVATALAGEQLGLKLIYLEAGSGADTRITEEVVAQVKQNISIPLIVGGGIRTPEDIRQLYKAGANCVVVGTAVEQDESILPSLAAVKEEFR
jgi:putative glycerol-1-phosphate prenyltransferase